MPTGITAMASTVTNQGIAKKQILMGLANGHILGVPKDLLDARRPKTKQEGEVATGLAPYHPIVPYDHHQSYITYNQVRACIMAAA